MAASGVSVVVIDLLRGGKRIISHPGIDDAAYLATVTRGGTHVTGAWPIALRDRLPAIPIPLLSPDPDAAIDLQALLAGIYERARYANDVDYSKDPPPPALSTEDAAWAHAVVAARAS
jgi:hypothetical protein